VHFATNAPASYILFADISRTLPVPANCVVGTAGTPDYKPGNCKYDTTGVADGIVQTYNFSRGFTVTRFCGKFNINTRYCSTDSGTPLTSLDVSFVRASTETAVNAVRNGNPVQLTTAEIYITSADGQASRAVCVNKVGQVSVALASCP
jgi:hypothetical protein